MTEKELDDERGWLLDYTAYSLLHDVYYYLLLLRRRNGFENSRLHPSHENRKQSSESIEVRHRYNNLKFVKFKCWRICYYILPRTMLARRPSLITASRQLIAPFSLSR